MEKHPYADIIHLPHHKAANRPHMSMYDRAAQFSPFAALSGFDGVIAETGRLTDRKVELSESEKVARSKYDDVNLGTKHKGQYDYYPILRWNSAELFLYIYQQGLTINRTYLLGNNRAGCLVCPMASKKGSWVREQLYGNSPDEKHSTRFFNDLIVRKTVASTMPPAAQREFMEFEGWKSRHDARKLSAPDLVYQH